MLKILKFLSALLISSAASAAPQKIIVDIDHLQMQRADGREPPFYILSPADTLELDASSYKFEIPEQLKNKPINSIQIVLEKDEQYSAVWAPGKSRYLLSQSTLMPNLGSKPFSGFRSGQTGVVAIGHKDGKDFSVVWVGMFRVK